MDVLQISVADLAPLHAAGAVVLDVREPDEYANGHVPGASLLPLGSVAARLDEVPADETVYVICHSGGRSQKAAEILLAHGVAAVNVAGGTSAWIEAGQPVVRGETPS